jgi:acyl-coenzyme A thioesterase PaaI-like protein
VSNPTPLVPGPDDALFVPAGDAWLPTPFARGPWDPNALHGGPISALLTRAIEGADTGGSPFTLSRVTVELLRPVPLQPLLVSAGIVRPGRKVQLIEAVATVVDTGLEVARARALRIRAAAVALPYEDTVSGPLLVPEPPPPGPEGLPVGQSTWALDEVAFHRDGAELRFFEGSWEGPGAVGVWVRLRVPVVPGEVPTGPQRAVAAADFGNGVARVLPTETFTFINPDLTVHLLRVPKGEWIALRSITHPGPDGSGLADTALYDEHGRVGRSVQSVVIDAR